MSKNLSNTNLAVGLTIALSAWASGSMDASAQVAHPGHQHGVHAGHNHASAARAGGAPAAHRSVHGGQMAMAGLYGFEALYRPKETRVYLGSADHRPLSAQGVQGQISLKVRGHDKVFRYPLKYVAPRTGSAGQDYLGVALDVSRIRDGDMTVTFELANLPNPQQPRATFTQTFALSKIPVTLAPLDRSDPPRIDRQKVCVVSGGRLGGMGTPLKVLVGDQPLYLCCKGCLGKVKENPDYYLAKAARLRAGR